jgi:hypothetical protein
VTSTPVAAEKASTPGASDPATSAGTHRVRDPEGGSTTVTDPVVGVATVVVACGGIPGCVMVVVPSDADPLQETASSVRAMRGGMRGIGGAED